MNQQIRTTIFNFSALLVLAGAILYITDWMYAPYLFALGTAGIAVCHLTLNVKAMSMRKRRLQRYNVFASLLMIFSSGLMFSDKKEWVVFLMIAAVFQVYTAFVNPKEEEK